MSMGYLRSSVCKSLIGFICFGFMSLFSDSCVQAQETTIPEKVLKVCSDAGFLPFEMRTSTGQWVGFDVDMINDFASSKNMKLEMIQIDFNGLIPALLSNKCQMIAAGMTITENRKQVVSFSHTTFVNGLSIAVKNTEVTKSQFQNLESIDKTGYRIAVKTGYTSDSFLSHELKNAQILRFDTDTDLFLAVVQGRAEAFVSDSTYVNLISRENPGKLFILPTNLKEEKFSVAIRKNDKELLQSFDTFLDNWKSSGKFALVYQKYFNNRADNDRKKLNQVSIN